MDRTMLMLAVAVCSLLLGWMASAARGTVMDTPANVRELLPWRDAGAVAHGRMLYTVQCSGCHDAGRNSGSIDVSSGSQDGARDHAWQQPDVALFQLVRDGASPVTCRTLGPTMPRFRDVLSDADVLAVLAYVKATWPSDLQREQGDVNALYARENGRMRQKVAWGGFW